MDVWNASLPKRQVLKLFKENMVFYFPKRALRAGVTRNTGLKQVLVNTSHEVLNNSLLDMYFIVKFFILT